ncbi:hypothetical protein CORC01_13856 [Colletotrichum orchidophilum]|uniref:Uncharacterized protein n=1 Tax=Colletotrichum orchidophilum TaxID=1209926 RepID=A0A1G4AP70_9PEZI|nr:hypothetical protein CORC01_13856 [Colletotrichum orchidophilum]
MALWHGILYFSCIIDMFQTVAFWKTV